MSLIGILIILVIVGVLMYLVNTLLPIDHRFKTIINVVVVIATLLWLADVFFGYSPRQEAGGCNRAMTAPVRHD